MTPVLTPMRYQQAAWAVRNCYFSIRKFKCLAAAVVCLFVGNEVKAASDVTLVWSPNTDPSVAGYNVYYGAASQAYTNVIAAGISAQANIGGLVEGKTYYFAVTAFDAYGDESDYSAETVYIVPGFLTMTRGTDANDTLHVRFPVAASHWYELQVSEDLRTWSTAWQVVGTSNTWVQFDAVATDLKPQFFRVVLH